MCCTPRLHVGRGTNALLRCPTDSNNVLPDGYLCLLGDVVSNLGTFHTAPRPFRQLSQYKGLLSVFCLALNVPYFLSPSHQRQIPASIRETLYKKVQRTDTNSWLTHEAARTYELFYTHRTQTIAMELPYLHVRTTCYSEFELLLGFERADES